MGNRDSNSKVSYLGSGKFIYNKLYDIKYDWQIVIMNKRHHFSQLSMPTRNPPGRTTQLSKYNNFMGNFSALRAGPCLTGIYLDVLKLYLSCCVTNPRNVYPLKCKFVSGVTCNSFIVF
jgi:hypothetical protein